jgi:hypothetical protein
MVRLFRAVDNHGHAANWTRVAQTADESDEEPARSGAAFPTGMRDKARRLAVVGRAVIRASAPTLREFWNATSHAARIAFSARTESYFRPERWRIDLGDRYPPELRRMAPKGQVLAAAAWAKS